MCNVPRFLYGFAPPCEITSRNTTSNLGLRAMLWPACPYAVHAARPDESDDRADCSAKASRLPALCWLDWRPFGVQHPRHAPSLGCPTESPAQPHRALRRGRSSSLTNTRVFACRGSPRFRPIHDELEKKRRQLQHTDCSRSLVLAIGSVKTPLAGRVSEEPVAWSFSNACI